MKRKFVICFLVDSLMPDILEKGINDKVVPAFEFLLKKGSYRNDCVTVFPTMTASIDASIVTGSYPDEHKVPGLIWYDPLEQKIINYINGGKCVVKLGISACAQNVLHNLNEKHISSEVTTLFEDLAQKGVTSASINLVVHRGKQKHSLRLSPLLRRLTRTDKNAHISGPDILTLGTFSYPEFLEPQIKNFAGGINHKYGINDSFAISVTKELIQSGKQPHFMMVYLPENDHRLHKSGPLKGEKSLIQVDRKIQEVLNCYRTWDDAIRENIMIITSDHGQTNIGLEAHVYNINLDQILEPLRVLQLGETLKEEHDLVVCNNERMAYIYPLHDQAREKVVQLLTQESRIDIIAWKENQTVCALQPGSKQKCHFTPDGDMVDPYGRRWDVQGELSILGVKRQGNQIEYVDYPDILSRLYGALFSQEIQSLVITARPHFEFTSRYFPKHNAGGSHGSLHRTDSYVPFLISEGIASDKLPRRLIEVKEFIVDLFSRFDS